MGKFESLLVPGEEETPPEAPPLEEVSPWNQDREQTQTRKVLRDFQESVMEMSTIPPISRSAGQR